MRLKPAWLIALLLCTGMGFAGGLYKWTDEKGVTHYGDSIPPQYKDRANQELSKKGVVLKSTPAALTQEQLAAQAREREARAIQELSEKERKRRDEALLLTYTSIEEIDRKRDRDVQQVELMIANGQAAVRSLDEKLVEQNRRADALTKGGRIVPEQLQEEIGATKAERKAQETLIGKRREELAAIRAKYEYYRSRFAELKGAGPSTPPDKSIPGQGRPSP